MPKAEVGDLVVVADTGAYTLSMYSRYQARCGVAACSSLLHLDGLPKTFKQGS